jgi:hypothetical protein
MNKAKQKILVKALAEAIVQDICGKIDANNIPACWDGLELGWLVHEKALVDIRWQRQEVERWAGFVNTCIVNDL